MIKRWKKGLVSTLALALGGVLLHALLAGGAVAQDKVPRGYERVPGRPIRSMSGIEQGFFPGIEFDIQRSSWQGANELLVANQVDIATSSDSDVTIHNASGVETTLAFPLYYFAGGGLMYDTEKHDWKSFDHFMEESGGDIEGSITKALQQTVGATVGVSAAAAEFSAFVEMLNIAGLTTESYNIVELVQEDLPPALFSGSIDIMIAGIPQRLAALGQGYGTLMDQTVVPSTVAQAGFAAHRSWVEENFELATRIQQGIFMTLQFIEDNPRRGSPRSRRSCWRPAPRCPPRPSWASGTRWSSSRVTRRRSRPGSLRRTAGFYWHDASGRCATTSSRKAGSIPWIRRSKICTGVFAWSTRYRQDPVRCRGRIVGPGSRPGGVLAKLRAWIRTMPGANLLQRQAGHPRETGSSPHAAGECLPRSFDPRCPKCWRVDRRRGNDSDDSRSEVAT